jgi:hypothetical protein
MFLGFVVIVGVSKFLLSIGQVGKVDGKQEPIRVAYARDFFDKRKIKMALFLFEKFARQQQQKGGDQVWVL